MTTKAQERAITKQKKAQEEAEVLHVSPPNFQIAEFMIEGTTPYVQCAFPKGTIEKMRGDQEAGPTGGSKRAKVAKDFEKCYEEAKHESTEGWVGIPAPCFRNAMISACKLVGFVMTRAKLAVFVEADGFDKNNGQPLVKFFKGEPVRFDDYVRVGKGLNKTTDIRPRPKWEPGWQVKLRVKWDADQFTLEDVANLLARVGQQVGIGEGRHDSRTSNGLGWGCFKVLNN